MTASNTGVAPRAAKATASDTVAKHGEAMSKIDELFIEVEQWKESAEFQAASAEKGWNRVRELEAALDDGLTIARSAPTSGDLAPEWRRYMNAWGDRVTSLTAKETDSQHQTLADGTHDPLCVFCSSKNRGGKP